MPPTRGFWSHKTQKWPKVFPLAKLETSLFWAETFCATTRAQLGCVFSFVLKNIDSICQEKQNTVDLVKKFEFWDLTNFVKRGKFYRNKISKREKNTHSNLVEVVVEKFSTRSTKPLWRKRTKTCFWRQKSDFEKHAKSWKFVFRFFTCNFFSC